MDTVLMIRKLLIGLLALAAPLAAEAQLYPLFGPVNGIMKGNAATPQTSAAASTDVITLFSGCSGSLYLKGDGSCGNPIGTGVTLTAPAPLTVTGSPGTSLALSWTTGQTANQVLASPNGSTGAVSLRALVGADIAPINLGSTANGGVLSTSILLGTNGGTSNGFFSITGPTTSLKTFTFPNASANVLTDNALVTVAQGGTGVGTITGLIKGNGTSALSAATSANVISLWTGTCSSTTFLRGDGACASAGGGAVGGATTNVQFNSSGVFAGDSGFTYAGTGTALSLTANTNAAQTFTLTNGSNGTGAATQNVWKNDLSHNMYTGMAGSGNTAAQFSGGGPTGEQGFLGTSSGPLIFGTANTFRGQITSDGRWSIPATTLASSPTMFISGTSTGNPLDLRGPTTGVTSRSFITFSDSAGSRLGYIGATGTTGGPMLVESDNNNINFIPLATTGFVQVSRDGGGSFQHMMAGASRMAWASVSASAGGCSLISNAYFTSCTRSATGTYQLGASPASQNNAGCVASVTATPSSGGRYAAVSGSSSTPALVTVYNSAGTAVDDSFQVICINDN